MNPLVAILISSMAITPSVVEQDGVRVEVFVRAQQYIWRVHNLGVEPITKFRIVQRNCYTQHGPPGWKLELIDEGRVMTAEALDPKLAIRPGRYGEFGTTVSSHGAALGAAPMTLTLLDGSTLDLEVWAPVQMDRRAVLTVVLTLCGVAFLHARIVDRKQKAGAGTANLQ